MEAKKLFIEFADYLFIEEDIPVVTRAYLFKTLPVRYEHLRRDYEIIGRASVLSILMPAEMDPECTIVLQRKVKKVLVAGVTVSDCSSLRRSVLKAE